MSKLQEYADLVVRVGVNIQKGQRLVLFAPIELREFAHAICEKAYDAGAKEVVTQWRDEKLSRMKFLRGDDSIFDEVPEWLKQFYNGYCDEQAALISIYASDPEIFKGVDPLRIQRNARASGVALKDYQTKQLANYFPWCIVSMPTKDWADKVFPSDPQCEDKLLDLIYRAVDVREEPGKTVEIWREKIAKAQKIADKLNNTDIKTLHFKNGLGTDFTIGLPEKAKWTSAGEEAQTGVPFVANIPTEEIFTVPHKSTANGVVYASKPYVLNGNIINNIKFVFKDGKIVEADASSGLEFLEKELDVDAGARFLGEVALVPYHSPISEMNTLFYNTLFDENASCHLAFGTGYPSFHDALEISHEEQLARGMNESHVHNDFMIGTEDLEVCATCADGKQVKIFTKGDFDAGITE